MKVGTDGVLLGTWATVDSASEILDVGTGTGLIAIMLAQRSTVHIDAVEIDENACRQAGDNITKCPWFSRINLIHASFQKYSKECGKTYDLIVSNPPYFVNQYHPSEKSRSVARHDDSLSIKELVFHADSILAPDGILSVIIPAESLDMYKGYLYQKKFYVTRILYVMPSPGKPVKRVLIEAGKKEMVVKEDSLVIESAKRHDYTRQYMELTGDFYLAF
jgi:tRNA1Val (adenine37-N6)-methyltransferase